LLSETEEVVTAGEKRQTRLGNPAQLSFGDGAAAVRTGADGAAVLIGYASMSHDLIDRYTSRDHPEPYFFEERFVRDLAVQDLLVPAVRAACASADIDPAQIVRVACAEPVTGCWTMAAAALKIKAVNYGEVLSEGAGDLGAAHPVFALGLALAEAKPGDLILAIGFGSGVDALIFKVARPVPGAAEMAQALREGERLSSFSRFLNLTRTIALDWGMRAEFEQKIQATVLERLGRDMTGFIGGRDSKNNVQFPKSAYPVNPAIEVPEKLADVRLADLQGQIVSITADRLNFTPDPPFDFGLVQFENGARVLMEMVNRPPEGFAVGDRVRMRFRIKSQNARLGFRSYFWKAAPLSRPQLGER
jgi:uncharacterized OB-fold protein